MKKGEHRKLDAMWFETRCSNPDCDHIYRWHRERKNKCPECGWDCGYLIDLSRGLTELKDFLPTGGNYD